MRSKRTMLAFAFRAALIGGLFAGGASIGMVLFSAASVGEVTIVAPLNYLIRVYDLQHGFLGEVLYAEYAVFCAVLLNAVLGGFIIGLLSLMVCCHRSRETNALEAKPENLLVARKNPTALARAARAALFGGCIFGGLTLVPVLFFGEQIGELIVGIPTSALFHLFNWPDSSLEVFFQMVNGLLFFVLANATLGAFIFGLLSLIPGAGAGLKKDPLETKS